MFRCRVRLICVVSMALLGACVPRYVVRAETVPLQAGRHHLDQQDHARTRFGELIYLSGIEITSKHRAFGGYSGLIVSPDGARMLAVSDAGHWLRAGLRYQDGKLVGVEAEGELAPMRDEAGQPYGSKSDGDAEAIASPGGFDGPVIVSFERDHRIVRYALQATGFAAVAQRIPVPADLARAPANKGLESVAVLADGAILALTERMLTAEGNTRGWLLREGAVTDIAVSRPDMFEPTDLSVLPNGDVLMLERRFTVAGGPGMRIRRIPAAALAGDSPLDGEILIDLTARYGIDNMEGLAVRVTDSGDHMLYVISDDNFNLLQKTLLLTFLLPKQG